MFFNFSPAELQYHTSVYSLAVQFPCLLFLINWSNVYQLMTVGGTATEPDYLLKMALLYIFNGMCFHFQTITAYVLMDFISPVTHRWVICVCSLNHLISTYVNTYINLVGRIRDEWIYLYNFYYFKVLQIPESAHYWSGYQCCSSETQSPFYLD